MAVDDLLTARQPLLAELGCLLGQALELTGVLGPQRLHRPFRRGKKATGQLRGHHPGVVSWSGTEDHSTARAATSGSSIMTRARSGFPPLESATTAATSALTPRSAEPLHHGGAGHGRERDLARTGWR